MRILHVIDSLSVGGAETLVTGLSSISKRAGVEVELYVLRGGGLLEADVREAGIPIRLSGLGSLYSPLHVLRFARFIKFRRFDIIHVHLYPAQLWVCLARLLSGVRTPIATTEHSTANKRRTVLFRWLDRWMYRQFSAIAAISESVRRALLAHIDVGVQIRVVPNGVDATRFEPNTHTRVVSQRRPLVVLCIGSLTVVKDQATIIRALAEVEGVRLVLAGDGPLRGHLESLASRLGVRARIQFLGTRRDIPQVIAESDLYVQSSKYEGFCLAAVEAMCGGLPCIVSRNSGLSEVVGDAGMYFEPGNADELASSIRLLSGDPERRKALSVRSLAQANRFSLGACSDGYESFYRDAIRQFWSIHGQVGNKSDCGTQ